MNRNLGVQGRRPFGILEKDPPRLQVVLKFLRLVQTDTTRALDLSKAFEVREFQLGDELVKYSVPARSGDSVHPEQNSYDFYLVCQGRVRLLGFDANQQREVSTLVLEQGKRKKKSDKM